eukprot:8550199-Alexandrium_andersonii.AAC.1
MEPLSDPRVAARGPGAHQRANGFAMGKVRVVEKVARAHGTDGCDQQRHGMRARDASSPAAREASGPPAPGAHLRTSPCGRNPCGSCWFGPSS